MSNSAPGNDVPQSDQPEREGASEYSLLDLNGAILDAVDEGIFGLTTEGITTFVNPAATRMIGWSAEELVGRCQHEVSHHTKRDGLPFSKDSCPILAVAREGVPHHEDADVFWRRDGSSFPVSYTATPLRRGGILCGSVVVFRDITERKRIEAEKRDRQIELENLVAQKTELLRQTNIQLTSVLEAASFFSVITTDLDGTITLFNQGAEQLLGYSRAEIIGKQKPTIFHLASEIEAREEVLKERFGREIKGREVFTLLAREGTAEKNEWTFVRKDGSHVPVCLAVTAMRDEAGAVIGYLGMAYDVTDQRIAAETLRAAKATAESANRAKSDFLATMSHEIRTPMNGIIGMADLLLNSKLDPTQRKRAITLRESGDALLFVLNDILDFSKMEANKLELEITDCNLRRMLESVADLMALKAQEKGLEFTLFIEPQVATMRYADPSRLRQILLNLVGNAIKFTSQGSVSLRVSQDSRGGEDGVHFEVSDTGLGIAQEKQHLLFARFSQADASTSRQFGGSGLGLSIARGLVELMGGQIGFRSEYGKGSTFWFTVALPLQQTAPRPPGLSLPGKRILVVDDSVASRGVLTELLSIWKCVVEQASDANSALERLQDRTLPTFDALLIDYDMPEFNGDRLGSAIRAYARLRDIPIILLTAFHQKAPPSAWEFKAFTGRVTKPAKQGELGTCLATALGFPMPTTGSAKAPTDQPTEPSPVRAPHRILLVEDNLVNQEVAMGLLEHLGYSAEAVLDAPTALRAMRENHYTLLLTDCQLPEMDGYELARQVRNPATGVKDNRIPIVALTAHSLSGDREKCLAAGMDDYLTKPLRRDALEQMLSHWIKAGTDAEPQSAVVETGPAIPQAAPSAVFDQSDLVERLMGNEKLARRVASAFLDSMPKQLEALANAINSFDAKATILAAHSIKGAAANAGGTAIRELASNLEQLGEEKALVSAGTALPAIAQAFESLKPEMQRFCDGK